MSPTITSDATTFKACKNMQQIASDNKLLLVYNTLGSTLLIVVLMTVRLDTYVSLN